MTGVEFLYLLSTSTSVHYLMYTIYKQTTKVAQSIRHKGIPKPVSLNDSQSGERHVEHLRNKCQNLRSKCEHLRSKCEHLRSKRKRVLSAPFFKSTKNPFGFSTGLVKQVSGEKCFIHQNKNVIKNCTYSTSKNNNLTGPNLYK